MKPLGTTNPKKRIHFQFGIRKALRKDLIVIGSFVAVTFLLSPFIGLSNGMVSGMGVIAVLISLSNDYTLEPVKNTCILTAAHVGIVLAAFAGYSLFPPNTTGYTIMMTSVTFLVFFSVVYLFTSEKEGNIYMPLLLNFSTMLYNPVYGWDLLIRVVIFTAYVGIIMLFQLLLHKNKFRRTIRQSMDQAIETIHVQITAIMTRESKELLLQRSDTIEQTILQITKAVGPKLAILSNWQAGHDIIRTLHILRRINKAITENYITGSEVMSQDVYNALKGMLKAIDRFENDTITESELIQQYDVTLHLLSPQEATTSAITALQDALGDFMSEEIEHEGQEALHASWHKRLRDKINLYHLIFAAKTGVIAALGILVTCLLHIENASVYIMTIAVIAQPYYEIGNQKAWGRITNTLFAIAMFLISFSITHNVWIHLAVLLFLIIVGDMFFQFQTNVIFSSMIFLVSRTLMDPAEIMSFTLYRLCYVLAACLILLFVDMIIFPKRLTNTLKKQMRQSLAVNQKLRAEFSSLTCSMDSISAILVEKRRCNQKIQQTNRFAQNEMIATYLMEEEVWIDWLTLINQRLRVMQSQDSNFQQLLYESLQQSNALLDQLTIQQKRVLTSISQVFEEMTKSEEFAATIPIVAA